MAEDRELLNYEEDAGNDQGEQQQQQDLIRRSLEVSALGRNYVVTERTSNRPITIKARYISRLLEHAHPMQMLQEVIIDQLQSPLLNALPTYQLTWSYEQQLKPTAINARLVMTQQRTIQELEQQLATMSCCCAGFDSCFKTTITDGSILEHCPMAIGTRHVLTTDLAVVQFDPLRDLLAHGLNHIPLAAADKQQIVECNCEVAKQFYDDVLTPTAAECDIELPLNAWDIISQSAEAWTLYQLQHITPQAAGFSSRVRTELKLLQQQLHICEVDKAPNTPCFVCPQYAQLLVLLRLVKSSDFEQMTCTISELRDKLSSALHPINPRLQLALKGESLPIIRIAYKSHKNNFRYLTNTSECMLSGLNSITQGITSCVMEAITDALGQMNNRIEEFVGVATQTCIVIPNAQHVAINLPDRIHTDLCADITKCFENIPIDPDQADSLPAALHWAVRKAFSYKAEQRGKPQVLAVRNSTEAYSVRWQHQPAGGRRIHPSGNIFYMSAEDVNAFLTLVTTNAYVSAAGLIFRQSRGIPIGADYSPNACNLYFMMYEYKAVMRMARLATSNAVRKQLCTEWLYCFRLMDDMRFINAPTLAGFVKQPSGVGDNSALGWIYPACVGIDITYDVTAAAGSDTQTTQYLDMLTHIQADGTYSIEIYDKQCKLPITPINYITLYSNRPVGNSYKLILGQASRVASICSSAGLAAKHVEAVIVKMGDRGFNKQRLLAILDEWAKKNDFIPGKTFTMTTVVTALHHRWQFWNQ